jgi:hypothetical protein
VSVFALSSIAKRQGIPVQIILLPAVSRPVCVGDRIVAHDQILITVGHFRSSCCGMPSLTRRRVCNNYSSNFLSLLGPSPAKLMTTCYCLIWDSRNREVQVPVFISHRNRVAQFYPQPLGSHFVASYDSQGYGGGSNSPPQHGLEARGWVWLWLCDRRSVGARGSIVVKALCYKPGGRRFDTRWGEFLNLPNPSRRTRPWGLLIL